MPHDAQELRILILTPTGKDAELITHVATAHHLQTVVCRDLNDLCKQALDGVGALLLAHEALMDTAPLTELLSQQRKWSAIPIILLTPKGSQYQAVQHVSSQLNNAGNLTLLERPLKSFILISVLRVALQSRIRQYEVRDLLRQLEASRLRLFEKVADLEKFEESVVGRELKMIELEKHIKSLQSDLKKFQVG